MKKPDSIPPETWKIIIPQLVNYAITHYKFTFWRAEKHHSDLVAEAKDVAFDAIKLFLTGQRHWNSNKCPDLLKFLKGVVDSLISHQNGSAKRKNIQRLQLDNLKLNALKDYSSPDQELALKELKEYLLEWAEQDGETISVILSLFEGMTRKEIIEESNLSAQRVDNIKKRVRRAASKFLNRN